MANFFKESAAFAARNTDLFNFISTSSVALWNLRRQVQGFIDARPDASAEELSGRFSGGTNIRANNLRGTCIETPWERQLEQFAQVVNANVIAMYEGWADELMSKFGVPGLVQQVQLPSRGTYGITSAGVMEALQQAKASGLSYEMKRAFYSRYKANRKYDVAHLDALLALYRYHKEIRNSLMHRGGIANAKAESAWRNVSTITRVDLGTRISPLITPVTDGIMVRTNIGEAIQLSDVLLRIVSTIDAELCWTQLAERTFIGDLRRNPETKRMRELPADPTRKAARIVWFCRMLGYVTPSDTEAIYELAHREHLFAY